MLVFVFKLRSLSLQSFNFGCKFAIFILVDGGFLLVEIDLLPELLDHTIDTLLSCDPFSFLGCLSLLPDTCFEVPYLLLGFLKF